MEEKTIGTKSSENRSVTARAPSWKRSWFECPSRALVMGVRYEVVGLAPKRLEAAASEWTKRPFNASLAVVDGGGVRVAAGDLVIADDTGVCFIPRDLVLEVLEAAEQKAKAEAIRCNAIDDGVPVPDISPATYGQK